MRDVFAEFETLTLPNGATSGKRIVIDGVNGVITFYDAANNAVIVESPDGTTWQSTGGYITIDPSVGAAPADVTQIRFGSGTRDPAIIEGNHFDADAEALQLTSGVRATVGYSRLQLRNDAVSLYANDTGAVLNGILLTPTTSTVNQPWQITGETWHNAALQNAWTTVGVTAFDAPGYKRDATGRVQLRGVAANGATAAGTVLFNLPAAYRPTKRKQLPITLNAGTTLTAVIQVMETGAANAGDVKLYGVPAANAVGLDGCSFDLI